MSAKGTVVGVLAIQGDFEAHERALARIGVSAREVLRGEEIDAVDALVLPGGETTTISKGMDRLELWTPIRDFAASGRPILGTCAGAILLSRSSQNHPVPTLGLLDVVAERNAYGTQVDSFAAPAGEGSRPGFVGMRCVFIRAPRLIEIGEGVEVLAVVAGHPVLVRQKNLIAGTFHPELTADPRVHEMLISR